MFWLKLDIQGLEGIHQPMGCKQETLAGYQSLIQYLLLARNKINYNDYEVSSGV